MDVEFDEDGDLKSYNDLYRYLAEEGILAGEAAAAFLAEELAGQTHGNYSAETLHNRANLNKDYIVTVFKRGKTPAKDKAGE